jgi:hypothetical protein
MHEFNNLPPLSPERLAELVSAPLDDDDPFARHWFTGEYEDPTLEATYRIFHLRLWGPRVRLLLRTIAVSGTALLHASNSKEVGFKLKPTQRANWRTHSAESLSLTHTDSCSVARTMALAC